MTEKEKCEMGILYDANYDEELLSLRTRCKDLCHLFNQLLPSALAAQREALRGIFKSVGKNCVVTAPFWCDYGYNITIGDDFYTNHNLIILDAAPVTIGNNVFIAPQCCISAAGHPVDHERRNAGLEFARGITIEDNVWIGTHVSILPGVTIGHNSVIGAGSVVSKDIPANVVAVGVPCRVVREISEQDREMYSSF